MSEAQIELLRMCISAMRTKVDDDDELVEVGIINNVSPRTAHSLVHAGLLEFGMPRWSDDSTASHVRLAKDPYSND